MTEEPSFAQLDRTGRWVGVGCAVLTAAAFVSYALALYDGFPEPTFDDSYMFVRYALHLLDGKGIAWNPDGVAIYGATSLPYLFLVTLGLKISPLSPGTTLLLISWSVGLAALLGLWAIGVRSVGSEFLKSWARVGAFLFPLVLWHTIFPMNAVTGMDTTLSFAAHALLIGCTLLFCRRLSSLTMLAMILAACGAVAVRPDNAVCAFLFPLLAIVAQNPDRLRSWIIQFGAGFGLFLLLDGILKYAMFGHFFPLGAHAKTYATLVGYTGKAGWNHVEYLQDFLTNGMLFFFAALICTGASSVRWAAAFCLPPLLTFAAFFSFVPIMGFDSRYQCPFLPYAMIGSLLVFDRFLQEHRDRWPWKRIAMRFSASCVLFLFLQAGALPEQFERIVLQDGGVPPARLAMSASESLPRLDFWQNIVSFSAFLRRLPRDITLAATEHGYVGAANPDIPIIDLSGLNSPSFAMKEFSADGLLASRPDIIWLPHPDYTGPVKKILLHPRFQEEYALYAGAFNFGIALARDGRRFNEIRQTLEGIFPLLYPGKDIREYIVHDIRGAGRPDDVTKP